MVLAIANHICLTPYLKKNPPKADSFLIDNANYLRFVCTTGSPKSPDTNNGVKNQVERVLEVGAE